jgi:hypothetical protein
MPSSLRALRKKRSPGAVKLPRDGATSPSPTWAAKRSPQGSDSMAATGPN